MTAAAADTPGRVAAGRATTAEPQAAVLARYDELADLLNGMDGRPPADPDLSAAAAPALLHEARLLDAGRFEEWLAGWTADAVLWLPLSAPAHPGGDQSLLLDDQRRLVERIKWRRDPSAWGQQPPSRTTRVVGSVEAWAAPSGIVTRSTLLIDEYRHGRHQQLAGCQVHELTGDDLRRRTKILVAPALATGVRNPSFLL
jgi:3-phenylpropionate/cinnamic acid dioxygenase small subunit